MSGSNDWYQFNNQNFPTQGLGVTPSISNSNAAATTTTNVVTTAVTHPPLGTMMNSGSPPAASSSQHLSPEGRVSKPTRRRSRASRRTPTTLLNTDTTNFRAMVQQFTGGPSASSGFPNLVGFGFGSCPVPPVNPNSTLMVSPPPGYFLQQQPQQNLFQPQTQQYMYSGGNTQGGGDNDAFFQRLRNPTRPPLDHDGVLMDHDLQVGRFFPSTSSS